MEKAIYNISNTGNKTRYYAILYRALEQDDMDTYQHIRDDLMNSMGVDGASIDSAMRSRYNKAVEKDPDYTLPPESAGPYRQQGQIRPGQGEGGNLRRGRPGQQRLPGIL